MMTDIRYSMWVSLFASMLVSILCIYIFDETKYKTNGKIAAIFDASNHTTQRNTLNILETTAFWNFCCSCHGLVVVVVDDDVLLSFSKFDSLLDTPPRPSSNINQTKNERQFITIINNQPSSCMPPFYIPTGSLPRPKKKKKKIDNSRSDANAMENCRSHHNVWVVVVVVVVSHLFFFVLFFYIFVAIYIYIYIYKYTLDIYARGRRYVVLCMTMTMVVVHIYICIYLCILKISNIHTRGKKVCCFMYDDDDGGSAYIYIYVFIYVF